MDRPLHRKGYAPIGKALPVLSKICAGVRSRTVKQITIDGSSFRWCRSVAQLHSEFDGKYRPIVKQTTARC